MVWCPDTASGRVRVAGNPCTARTARRKGIKLRVKAAAAGTCLPRGSTDGRMPGQCIGGWGWRDSCCRSSYSCIRISTGCVEPEHFTVDHGP